jgi:hypothetical protein
VVKTLAMVFCFCREAPATKVAQKATIHGTIVVPMKLYLYSIMISLGLSILFAFL